MKPMPAKPSSSLQLRGDPRRNSDVLNEKGFHLVAPAPALTFVLAVVYCRPLERAANYPAVVRIIKSLKQLVQVLHKIFAGDGPFDHPFIEYVKQLVSSHFLLYRCQVQSISLAA